MPALERREERRAGITIGEEAEPCEALVRVEILRFLHVSRQALSLGVHRQVGRRSSVMAGPFLSQL